MQTTSAAETLVYLLPVLIGAVCLTGCGTARRSAAQAGRQYVRVEEKDGRHWFVRGEERFLSLGVNVVSPRDDTTPSEGTRYDVLQRYGNDERAWAEAAARRLRSWGFNTAGAWSHEAIYRTGLHHTRLVYFGPWGAGDPRLVDVFADGYAADIERTAREYVAPHATDEYLIGYFLNNELPWYGDHAWPSSPGASLLARYLRLPPSAPGKQRAIAFLRERYADDFDALRENWEILGESFAGIDEAGGFVPRTRRGRLDGLAWTGVVAERYFALCCEAVRRHDPNHLILGVRFCDRAPEPVIAACGRHVDVVSVNQYRRSGRFDAQLAGAIAALTGKPVMMTEFSWRARENSSGCPNSKGASVTVETQRDRADAFRRYVRAALAQPYIVGYAWFMYHDQPSAGRFDGEDSNYGLVDNEDQPYAELIDAVERINRRACLLHAESAEPQPSYDPVVLADHRETVVSIGHQPLTERVLFVDGTSPFRLWGDFGAGAALDVVKNDAGAFRIRARPAGWGCGITFDPQEKLPKHPDASANVFGASALGLSLRAPSGTVFSVGLEESGHGPLDSQTFDGAGGADGESYGHAEVRAMEGQHEYAFELRSMEPSAQYGNQRGNHVVDTMALSSVHVFFPRQGAFDADLECVWLK